MEYEKAKNKTQNQTYNLNMAKLFLFLGAILAGLSVAIGAFGAHGLRELLAENGRVETFETAVKYQFYHALSLLFLGLLILQKNASIFVYSGWVLLFGTIIFSGTLYILCLTNKTWLGAITPIGGTAMLIGWGMLAWGILQKL